MSRGRKYGLTGVNHDCRSCTPHLHAKFKIGTLQGTLEETYTLFFSGPTH